MRAEELDETVDLPAFVEYSCLAVCKSKGRGYTERVRAGLVLELSACRDEKKKLALMQLLAKVETLIDQQELPLDPRDPA